MNKNKQLEIAPAMYRRSNKEADSEIIRHILRDLRDAMVPGGFIDPVDLPRKLIPDFLVLITLGYFVEVDVEFCGFKIEYIFNS